MDLSFIVADFFLWMFIGVVSFPILAIIHEFLWMIQNKIIRKKEVKRKETETCTK